MKLTLLIIAGIVCWIILYYITYYLLYKLESYIIRNKYCEVDENFVHALSFIFSIGIGCLVGYIVGYTIGHI